LKPWKQELMWVRRNDQGAAVRIEETLPEGTTDFIPMLPHLVKRDPVQYVRNIHDEKRKRDLIKSLLTAKEKASVTQLYLTTNDRVQEDIWNIGLVIEHIDIALEHLGVTDDAAGNA
jgi:hypothetical protein